MRQRTAQREGVPPTRTSNSNLNALPSAILMNKWTREWLISNEMSLNFEKLVIIERKLIVYGGKMSERQPLSFFSIFFGLCCQQMIAFLNFRTLLGQTIGNVFESVSCVPPPPLTLKQSGPSPRRCPLEQCDNDEQYFVQW